MSKALYRKYRSKRLDEIVGQNHVTDILDRSLKQGRIAHAYLLTGPRGVGKTSIARILAHAINNLDYTDDSSHLDIIEIDAASNNGVDDVRELRDRIQVAPVSAQRKVYIIDEVHMLSKAAFNALLKTLEEPPEHVVFVLATTDVDKLPATVISRTQQFTLRLAPQNEVAKHLGWIAKQEGIAIEEPALDLIAQRGGGTFRDSIGLLDQLQHLGDSKTPITRVMVEQMLGLAPHDLIEQIIQAYEAKNLASITQLVVTAHADGLQAGVLASQLIDTISQQIATKPQLVGLLDELLEVSKSVQPHIKLLTVLGKGCVTKPKSAALAAPMPVIEAKVKDVRKLPPDIAPSSDVKQAYSPRALVTDESATPEAANTSPSHTRVTRGGAAPSEAIGEEGADRAAGPASSEATSRPTGEDDASGATASIAITLDWPALIECTRIKYVAVYSVLSKCKHDLQADKLIIYTNNAFYKKKLDDAKHRQNLLKALDELGAGSVIIETIPTTAPPKDSQAAAIAAIMGGGEEVSVDEVSA